MPDSMVLTAKLLVLLTVANTAPIAVKRLLCDRWNAPLDGGLRFFDGKPLLGHSKTVRGVVAATVATLLMAPLMGFPAPTGAAVGLLSMAGDLLSSFVKRRLGIPSSGKATGLDQVPEALLPLLVLRESLGLAPGVIAAVTLLFLALEGPVARWSCRHGWRDTPY
ncbi:hypothetical protein [Azohydromonas australica]|uniref:hypothetical protein n=1 Tax=Azohydromonas australica TaxID=364039 RepID=UPI00041D56BC|nr:hypothetical protein [Azohydromonas australica]